MQRFQVFTLDICVASDEIQSIYLYSTVECKFMLLYCSEEIPSIHTEDIQEIGEIVQDIQIIEMEER